MSRNISKKRCNFSVSAAYLVVVEGIHECYEPPSLSFLVQGQLGNVSNEDGVKQPGHLQVVAGPQRLKRLHPHAVNGLFVCLWAQCAQHAISCCTFCICRDLMKPEFAFTLLFLFGLLQPLVSQVQPRTV